MSAESLKWLAARVRIDRVARIVRANFNAKGRVAWGESDFTDITGDHPFFDNLDL
jgi:hypothetical protein